jgi:hypothetical protein
VNRPRWFRVTGAVIFCLLSAFAAGYHTGRENAPPAPSGIVEVRCEVPRECPNCQES